MTSLERRLTEVVRTVPYNNAGPLFQKAGREDLRFGGSCVQQQRVLRERLADDGIEMNFLVSPRNHTIGIVRDGTSLKLLDVAFRAKQTAEFDFVPARGTIPRETVAIDAFSTSDGLVNLLTFDREGEDLSETLVLVSGQSVLPQKYEVFDLSDATDSLPDIERDIDTIRAEKSILIVAVLGDVVLQLRADLDGAMSIRPSNGPRVRPNKPAFGDAFKRIAGMNGGTPDELHAYLKEASFLLKLEL
jgi:hypothetical protein